MDPFAFVKRRPVTTLSLLVTLAGAVVFGLYKMRVSIPALHTTEVYAQLDKLTLRLEQLSAKVSRKPARARRRARESTRSSSPAPR